MSLPLSDIVQIERAGLAPALSADEAPVRVHPAVREKCKDMTQRESGA
jgi:hypothetical protein